MTTVGRPRNALIILLRSAATLSLPIAFCLFIIDKTQKSGFYTNSDALYFSRLAEDVFQRPWGLKSWVFQPVPDYIPSIPIYLVAQLVTFDFRRAIIVAALIQTCLFFGIGILLYRRYRPGGEPLVWSICLVAVLALLISVDRVMGLGYSASVYSWIFWMFLLNAHFGSLMVSLLCFYFSDRALRERLAWPAAAIFVCSVLGSLSDYFFLLIFTAPMVVVLLWLWLVSDVQRRCLVTLAVTSVGGAIGYLLGLLVNHTANDYLKPFDVDRMSNSLHGLTTVFSNGGPEPLSILMSNSLHGLTAAFSNGGPEPLSILVLALNLAVAVYAAIVLHGASRRCSRRPLNDIPFLDVFVLTSAGASAAASIAVVVFGIFVDVWTLRYLNCVVFMPAIIAALLMTALVEDLLARLAATRRQMVLTVGAALTVVSSTVLAAGTRIDLKPPNHSILACLEREKAVAGLADYWNASPLILFSHWKYQVVQIGSDARPSYWMNNRAWVNHDWSDPERAPRYSFIVIGNLPLDRIVDAYGRPDRVISCDGTEIWFYDNIEELTSRVLGRM